MRFVDRLQEMDRLNAVVQRGQGGLVVVYGRRRIGKTRLLLEWGRRHGGLYSVADQSAPEIQRRYFAQAVAEKLPAINEATYDDWRALLRAVAREATHAGWHGPLIIDELPYLVVSSPELPSLLQHWVDHEAAEARLVVAVAGSSQRMMQGLVLEANAPLYGRATAVLALPPIRLGHLCEGIKIADPVVGVMWYAAFGGVPRYWELAEAHAGDFEAAVDGCVLDPLSPLHREPDRLLLDELPPAASLRPILDAIGLGSHRLTEIGGRIGQPATSLARPLGRLVEMGLVRRELPFGESAKSAKRVLYKSGDPFLRFWFRAVAPNRGSLAQATTQGRLSIWKRLRSGLFAEAWEELCRESVGLAGPAQSPLGRFGPWLPAARFWHGKGPEWDVVSRSVDGKRLLLGEVKWSDKPVSTAALGAMAESLLRKGVPPPKSLAECQVVRCLFVPQAESSASQVESTLVMDATQVLRCLR